jgi:hypothetical protein
LAPLQFGDFVQGLLALVVLVGATVVAIRIARRSPVLVGAWAGGLNTLFAVLVQVWVWRTSLAEAASNIAFYLAPFVGALIGAIVGRAESRRVA